MKHFKLHNQIITACLFLALLPVGCAEVSKQKDPVLLLNNTDSNRIDSVLEGFVLAGDLAGVSALIYENGEEVYFNTFGKADRENNIPMARNTIVQIYSMTKPLTGTALMQLYEKEMFDLDDPVADYLPEFAGVRVYAGEDDSGSILLETPRREMTIRDLTRHTAGFANHDAPGVGAWFSDADPMNFDHTLSEMAGRLAEVPLVFHPGERWYYGIAVDVQALLVERISGIPFHQYLKKHILDPLGMTETRYYVPESDRDRMAVIYQRIAADSLAPDPESGWMNTRHHNLKPGGYGLTSTLDDYMRFMQMLVKEGEYNGVRILQPETVRLMATDHLPDDVTDLSWLPTKGNVGFGINFAVRTGPPLSEEENYGVTGEFFWDGAASTLFWIDPVHNLTALLFVQLMPYDPIGLHKDFRDAVYGVTY